MSEVPIRRRRRWPWGLLAVALFLFVGPIAWRFRPLNGTERALLGTWRVQMMNPGGAPIGDIDTIYTADRRWEVRQMLRSQLGVVSRPLIQTGHWSATNGRLSFSMDSRVPVTWNTLLTHVQNFVLGSKRTESATFAFEGPDALRITFEHNHSTPAFWTRVRESPAPEPASPPVPPGERNDPP